MKSMSLVKWPLKGKKGLHMLIRPAIHQKDKETEVAVWCRMIMWITVDLVLEEEWKECIKTTRCFGGFV